MTVRLTIAADNQAQGRKKKTLAGSHYFYTEESIPRTNFHAHLSLFACTLHAQLRPLHPCNIICEKKTLKKFGPLLWVGFDCFKARATLKRQFIFYQKVPRNSWYSFYQPQKDERLSQPWGYPVEHGAPELGIQHLIDH